jgi:hypothetical protein
MRQICYAYLTSDITSEKTVKNTEGTINKKGQSRETGNIGYTIRSKTQHNVCLTPLYTNTNHVNKTWTVLQTAGGKDKPNKHKSCK